MLFDLIQFLGWPWLVAFHLIVVALVLGPFGYVWLREWYIKKRDEQ